MSFRLKLMLCIVLLIALTFGIGGTVLITVSFHGALSEQTAAILELSIHAAYPVSSVFSAQ